MDEAKTVTAHEVINSNNSRKKNLYEDYRDGILSKEEYSGLRDQYQGRIAEIEKNIAALQRERESVIANGSGRQEWVKKIRGYEDAQTLDRELVSFLIERIEVFDDNAVRVTYRFQKEIEEMERIVELYSERTKEAV